jgi:hypothetical protein
MIGAAAQPSITATMPRGQCARRGPVGSADVHQLEKALRDLVDANIDSDSDDGALLRVFDVGEYLSRTGAATVKNPPRFKSLARAREVLKLLTRFSPRGDGNIKHDELRRVFNNILSSKSPASIYKQNPQTTADLLSNKYRLMAQDLTAILQKKQAFKTMIAGLPDRIKSALMKTIDEVEVIRELHKFVSDGGKHGDYDLGSSEFCLADAVMHEPSVEEGDEDADESEEVDEETPARPAPPPQAAWGREGRG